MPATVGKLQALKRVRGVAGETFYDLKTDTCTKAELGLTTGIESRFYKFESEETRAMVTKMEGSLQCFQGADASIQINGSTLSAESSHLVLNLRPCDLGAACLSQAAAEAWLTGKSFVMLLNERILN